MDLPDEWKVLESAFTQGVMEKVDEVTRVIEDAIPKIKKIGEEAGGIWAFAPGVSTKDRSNAMFKMNLVEGRQRQNQLEGRTPRK